MVKESCNQKIKVGDRINPISFTPLDNPHQHYCGVHGHPATRGFYRVLRILDSGEPIVRIFGEVQVHHYLKK